MKLTRRHLLVGLGAALLSPSVRAQSLDGGAIGLLQDSVDDQSAALEAAMNQAVANGRPLFIPAGTYRVGNLLAPSGLRMHGVPGRSMLTSAGTGPILRLSGSAQVSLQSLGFVGATPGTEGQVEDGLVTIDASSDIAIEGCSFTGGSGNGVAIRDAAATITGSSFAGHGLAAIFSLDSRGLMLSGNRIIGCENNGIQIWGSQNRHDGSIITGNTIARIGWRNGGNGQNGNGINVFRADDVVVANNQLSDCAFTAIRLNSTNNVTVSGNVCRASGEVAIFSEFAFSGSVITGNLIDGAAGGISVTNLDSGGHLAVVSGNIVRDIAARSEVNPDTTPFGIFAEADVAVTGNSVDAVPGVGIGAGWGPYLRNVLISNNNISGATTGIAVTVAEQPGAVRISGNLISGATHGIVGMAWTEMRSDDLVRDAAQFQHVSIEGNVVVPATP
jgi:uncharacterized secreted repeat protein (TIGR03808 family)